MIHWSRYHNTMGHTRLRKVITMTYNDITRYFYINFNMLLVLVLERVNNNNKVVVFNMLRKGFCQYKLYSFSRSKNEARPPGARNIRTLGTYIYIFSHVRVISLRAIWKRLLGFMGRWIDCSLKMCSSIPLPQK